jgi:hypothetical protein
VSDEGEDITPCQSPEAEGLVGVIEVSGTSGAGEEQLTRVVNVKLLQCAVLVVTPKLQQTSASET